MLITFRYQLYSRWLVNLLLVKHCLYTCQKIRVTRINLIAGLYRPNSTVIQHSLLLSIISSVPSSLSYQIHGKRQRCTVAYRSVLYNNEVINPFLDKFVHEIIPIMIDFRTIKWKWSKRVDSPGFTLRLRHKMWDFDQFSDLLEPFMYDTHRGVFLPLTVHVSLVRNFSRVSQESYLRMLRLPVNFFVIYWRPAFDDAISFVDSTTSSL